MTDHPITPPPELVQQWLEDSPEDDEFGIAGYIATQAARWGADQELEACCEVLARELICDGKHVATDLRAARRPKPPSLAEQALAEINEIEGAMYSAGLGCDFTATRRALERLQELEGANG